MKLQGIINRLKKYDEQRDIELHARVIAETREKVAREIFEEIERYVIKGISVGGEHLTLFNGKNYSELKKKYTEGDVKL